MRILASVAMLLAAPAALAQTPFENAKPVPDPGLEAMRGGFRLPNGIDVSMVVQSTTAVNGAVVLQSVFKADTGMPILEVYAPVAGEAVAGSGGTGARTGAGGVQVDRQNGLLLVQSPNSVMPTVSVNNGSSRPAGVADGLVAVDLAKNGAAAATGAGLVSLREAGAGRIVNLQGESMAISHLFGNGFGSVIANSADNRVIDTFTTVSLDLSNAGPAVLGSSMFRVEAVALDATRMLVR